jgi:hypothetical protein
MLGRRQQSFAVSLLLLVIGASTLAACGTASAPASAPSATAARTSTTSMPTASTNSPNTAPPESVDAFLSPLGNINCEIAIPARPTVASCELGTPAQSVSMSETGVLTDCSGDQCLGNVGAGIPALDYGQSTSVGIFTCLSEATGVTCTVPGGKGFKISESGVSAVG